MSYVLHYAPDNASLIIRMALTQLEVPFETVLVDRAAQAQRAPSYRALNPNGLIPTLETPGGPIFETGAILLWLSDTHGRLGPAVADPARADFLKWLFYLSNTTHPALRMMFYPDRYIGDDAADQAALRLGLQKALLGQFEILDQMLSQRPPWAEGFPLGAFDFYLAAMLRWVALYPQGTDKSWFSLEAYPALRDMCLKLEASPVCACLIGEEGMDATPFSAPKPVTPTVGSAT